jgi:hypothetical protein
MQCELTGGPSKAKTLSASTPSVFGEQKNYLAKKIAYHSTQSNILDLVLDLKHTGTSRRGPEYHGPCPFCGGTDRFTVWPEQGETGRYWCRQCNWKGDAIQLLRDRDGLSFMEAKRSLGLSTDLLPRRAIAQQKARSAALAATRDSYKQWAQRTLTTLTDENRELLSEQEVAEIAVEQIQRRPDLYLDRDEAMDWIGKLYAIQERIAELEKYLDLLTYDKNALDCVRWWKQEMEDAIRSAA